MLRRLIDSLSPRKWLAAFDARELARLEDERTIRIRDSVARRQQMLADLAPALLPGCDVYSRRDLEALSLEDLDTLKDRLMSGQSFSRLPALRQDLVSTVDLYRHHKRAVLAGRRVLDASGYWVEPVVAPGG
ncbi:hypothetical protein [Caulobacter hibisci]|uniref:Uncharacterized protein n=1 Tax=Caulobacter hibisci TaxID=2035993 RepID=A0ABS0SZZ5_9CAUL|nr:hypothetical protein [Caulobacter hibisci]MBI1685203.1 hypothetical protein [Caulobacter hibisci]